MALSILEIAEDDCGTEDCMEIIINSKSHAESLVDKYYKEDFELDEWKILTEEKAYQLINRKIQIRTPMLCKTPNFKMCKKCFGNRFYPTKYLGITAGQSIAER